MLAPLPENVTISNRLRATVDMWSLFTRSRSELARMLPKAMYEIQQDGLIWVSWPNKAPGVPSEVTEDV